ncbi:nuclear transport factor 2 family protein [Nocardioides sp. L-11A]|uniref:nuclear transport factor 2 family protein n=1 Tax=Nocardioides sp. L-11A TaxID=3043848 RepID=UPI00249A5AC6|nr:nuclear transport factor 2 family protein [Nocardioides sp. L-11A]
MDEVAEVAEVAGTAAGGLLAGDRLRAGIQLLLDEREISRTVLRYAHGVDRGDVDMVESCYHPGAYDEHGYASGTVEEFAARLRQTDGPLGSRHHLIGNLLIEVRGDVAVCESYFLCYLQDLDPAGDPVSTGVFAGRYVDRLARREGAWRVERRICVMDWSRALSPASPGRGARTFAQGSRDERDPAVLAFRELAGA